MIHYSCDRCGKKINPDLEVRYVVRIEIEATEDDSDSHYWTDAMELEDEDLDEPDSPFASEDDMHQRRQFDLCPDCCTMYMKNPLASEPQVQIDFSDN